MNIYFILGGIITILFVVILVLIKLLFSRKPQIIKKSTYHINIEKIKDIAKLATIECFMQVVSKEEDEKKVMKILGTARKKLLIIVKGTVLIGFDLAKCQPPSGDREKPYILLPAPEILSSDIESWETYDEQQSIWNLLKKEDRDLVYKNAREELRKSATRDEVLFRARKSIRAILSGFLEPQGIYPIIEFSDQKTIVEKEIKKLPEEKNVENTK